ncbi:TOG array regulator of axonemal microtubules protein 1-like isoform X2 [Acanthaster planci]|uniref:TOG array regulator of axonemal microtubules protein 1-like isoform X2 n=1 Tax=Acanthaster planci TaxID=133434 RepID=A0A8B7YCK8_ACAPL|nr:TOG array regulator of axonemal microtubules protein 1-like isoform X2 [Acanthaster planci]
MAGTVAKRPVHNFSHVDLQSVKKREGEREYSDHPERSAAQRMDEDDILAQLEDDGYAEQRAFILDDLTQKVRRDGGRLPFDNRHALFRGLTLVLLDQNWEVRLKCIQFICELIPQFGPELDSCMAIVLPQIVANLGDSRVAIRKAVIQTLHIHMKHTTNVQQIFTILVTHGLQSRDPKVRMEATIQLPVLLTREFASVDLSSITHALAKKFCEDKDETLIDTAGISLERIRSLVGKQQFDSYIQQLPSRDRNAYNQRVVSAVRPRDTEIHVHKPAPDESSPGHNKEQKLGSSSRWQGDTENGERYEFGIIPKHVMDQLLDQTQWKTRANGVQELKTIISALDDASRIVPHMLAFISFLCNLLDDVNFKVTLLTLEIYGVLVTKLNTDVKQFLKPLIAALTKRFGDNKVVIRQANMKVLMQLMHVLTPQSVVSAIGDSLKHRKSGVREEALNIIIASLLTFPSYDFDLAKLCQMLAPMLADAKRRVRQAALESFAVLAQAMGPSRIQPLIHAVDQVELNMDEDGVMKAVQARLARRRLPRLNEDGLVEYATAIPTSATSRNNPSMSKENDVQWIMKGTGSITSGSARERSHVDPRSLELSQPSPTRAIPGQTSNQESSPPKRYFSAGRGRGKLPWEEESDTLEPEESLPPGNSVSRTHIISSAPTQKKRDEEKPPPIKARNTWDSVEETTDMAPQDRRRPFSLQIAPTDASPDTNYGMAGSYRQIHLDKLKRQSLAAYPGSRGSPHDDQQGSLSAPATERGGHDPFAGSPATILRKRPSIRQDSDDPEARLPPTDKYVSSFGSGTLRENGTVGVGSRGYRKSLSNSWPESHFLPDEGSKGKKKVNQRADPPNLPDWSPEYEPKKSKGAAMASPIPLKPTLARSAGRRGQGRTILDPLDRNQAYKGMDDIEDLDLYADDFELSDEDSEPDLSSLQNVRSSAAKKRAEKLASRDLDRHCQSNNNLSSTVSPLDESGFFSMFSTMNSSKMEDSLERYPVSKKKGLKANSDVPFSTKPRMARSSSGKGSRRNSLDRPEDSPDAVPFEYSPSSGVTFRHKPTSDVSIVGQGYGSNRTSSPPIPTHAHKAQNGQERRRQQKGPLLSPLSMASLHHTGGIDVSDQNNSAREDLAIVIGKNVFNGKNTGSDASPTSNLRKKSDAKEGGVKGRHYTRNSSSPESDGQVENGEEDAYNIAMSRALQDKMVERQLAQKKELEQRQAEVQALREKAQQEREERRRTMEAERRQAMEEEREAQRKAAEEEREAKRRALEAEREERRRILEEKAKRRKEAEEKREARNRALEEERKEAYRKAKEEERERARQRAEQRQRDKLRHLEMENNTAAGITDLQISGSNPANPTTSPAEVDLAADMETGTEAPHSPTKVVGKPPVAGITPKKKKAKSPTEPASPKHHNLGRSISGGSQSGTLNASLHEANSDVSEMRPFSHPDKVLQDALKLLGNEDWEAKMDGLQIVRRLSTFHQEEVIGQMHTVVVAVLNEVKNLRSSVSKMAIMTMGDMFQELQQALDKELEQICKILMPKAGESNAFIREDVDKALDSMVQNVSPQRALCALISAGVSHKNQTVRKTTAMHLNTLVDRMGPGRLLSGVKDITDKILPAAASLALDNGQETRFYARKMLYSMIHHESFNKLIEKYVPAKDLRSLKEVLENLRLKGPGDLPHDSSSARVRRSHSNTRNNSGSSPASRDKIDSAGSDHALSSSMRRTNRNSSRGSETNQETVKDLCKLLSAADWTERLQGITQVQELAETNVELITANIIKIFDNFTSRLTDSNSKVNQVALQTMLSMVPRLGEYLGAVVTGVVPVVSGNLASKNAVICKTSEDILDSIIEHVDKIVLIQPFSSATQYGNARVKPKMVEKLAYLSTQVYPRKQQTVVRNVLPVLWHLLGSLTGSGAVPGGTGNLRGAVNKLAKELHSVMGEALVQHASSLPPRQRNTLMEILGV